MTRLITEADVLNAKRAGHRTIHIEQKTIITPAARDTARIHDIQFDNHPKEKSAERALAPSPKLTQGPVAIGSDHGGFDLKTVLIAFLHEKGFQVKDHGCFSTASVDYPDIAHQVAEAVRSGQAKLGIIIDGAGIGSAIVANKLPGIRAACCNDLFTAVNSREHNGANILTLGGRVIGDELAKKIVLTWLETDFGGGRHKKRLDKVDQVDSQYRRNL